MKAETLKGVEEKAWPAGVLPDQYSFSPTMTRWLHELACRQLAGERLASTTVSEAELADVREQLEASLAGWRAAVESYPEPEVSCRGFLPV